MTDIDLHIANFLFYAFHTILIILNLFGWIIPETRKLNLIFLLTTFTSWLLLGFWKGWGYCFLTDWHYRVLNSLGEKNLPSSYISFLVRKLTGWLPNADLVDYVTVGLALLALMCSLWVNIRHWKREKRLSV